MYNHLSPACKLTVSMNISIEIQYRKKLLKYYVYLVPHTHEIEEDADDEHTYTSIEELKKNKKLKQKRKSKKEKRADAAQLDDVNHVTVTALQFTFRFRITFFLRFVYQATYANNGPEREAALVALGNRGTLARRSNREISTTRPKYSTVHASLKRRPIKAPVKGTGRSATMKVPKMPVIPPRTYVTRNIGRNTIPEKTVSTHVGYEDMDGGVLQEPVTAAYEMMDLQGNTGYTDMAATQEQIQDIGDYSEVGMGGASYLPMSPTGELVDEAYSISH